MSNDAAKQCRALLAYDETRRCSNRAKYAGFCGVHLPRPKTPPEKASSVDRVRDVAEFLALLGGVLGLVEYLVRAWQMVPFGDGPTMPESYRYLQGRLGFEYPELPKAYSPANYGVDSVNWAGARRIYDAASASMCDEDPRTVMEGALRLEGAVVELMDSVPEQVRFLLHARIGQDVANPDY